MCSSDLAMNARHELFGAERLDAVFADDPLSGTADPDAVIDKVLAAVATFTADHPANDDRTLLAARVG